MGDRAKWPAVAFLMVTQLGLSAAFGAPPDGGVGGDPSHEQRPPCGTLEVCLAQLDARAAFPANLEIDQFDEALAKALRVDGKAAVPHLLRVLAGPDSKARDVAAYTLCDIDGLTADDAPALLRALAAGEDWIAPAVAGIGSPEAITALFAALKARPDYDANTAPAFKRLGRKGVPILLSAFDCRARSPSDVSAHRNGCQENVLEAISIIFGMLGPEARDAVAPLTAIARDRKRPWAFRAAAVESLGEIGESAASAAPALRQLARAEPKRFRELVESALVGMRPRSPAQSSGPASATPDHPPPKLDGKLVFGGAIVDLASGRIDRRRPLEGTAEIGELSPDGASLALVSCLGQVCDAVGERQVELLDLKSGKSQALARANASIFPSFSPDGALLLLDVLWLVDDEFSSQGYVFDPKRSLVWTLTSGPTAWSARCDRFIEPKEFHGSAGFGVVTTDLKGGRVRRLDPPSGLHALAVQLSPDESKIAYTGPGVDPWVLDLKSGRRRRLVRTPTVTEKVAFWSPDGRWLATWIMTSAFDDAQLWAWDLASSRHIVLKFAGLDEYDQRSSPLSWWAPAPLRDLHCAPRLEAAYGAGNATTFPLRLQRRVEPTK